MIGDDSDLDSIGWTLVQRYLDGEATDEERARVSAWMDLGAGRRQYVESLREMGEAMRAARPRFNSAAAWEHMQGDLGRLARMRQRLHLADTPRETGAPRLRLISGAVGLAAATAITVTVGYAALRGRVAQPLRAFSTSAGNRATITLRDGSRLVLGPDSRLVIPADYGRSDRAVELDGEAFFAIVHDAAHPFSVRAGNAIATDIGTQFDVRAYPDDRAVRVAVSEGSVALGTLRASRNRPPVLTRGNVATVSDTVMRITHGANVAAMTAWVQGGLAFADAPLSDVVRDLARTFDLDIAVADSALLGKRITAAFGSQPPDEILTAVTLAIGAQFDRTGRRVVISVRESGARRDRQPVAPESAMRGPPTDPQ